MGLLTWRTHSVALACTFACSSLLAQISTAKPTKPPSTSPNPIQVENQKPGTSAWQIGLAPYVNSNDTDQWIRGYASAVSINKGATITFNITVNPYNWKPGTAPVPYTIDVYRIGWYGGRGGRLMKHLGPFPGKQQPGGTSANGVTSDPCGVISVGAAQYQELGLIECQWSGDGLGNGSYTLDTSIPPDGSTTADWTSGIYVALLTTKQVQYPTGCGNNGADPCDPDHQSYIIFVIREDGRSSQLLYDQPISTYQAYNNYPSDGTYGKSLYDGGSSGPTPTVFSATEPTATRAVQVSFDRPYTYTDHTGAGDFLHWELYFVRWMERNGYDVTYTTDVDVHAQGNTLLQHRGALVAGHPEYWSHEMRTAFETARDSGVSLGFFSANTAYAQIRFTNSTAGTPNRIIVCYKNATIDPYNNSPSTSSLTTVPFRSSPVSLPEQTLLGSMYADYFSAESPAYPYVVQNSTNWVYSGTGLFDGSSIAGVTGYELDEYFSAFPAPTSDPQTYFLLSNSPFTGSEGIGFANSAVYEAPSGAWVFNSATMDWSWGLDNYAPPAGIDTRAVPVQSALVQQITANILNRFITVRPTAPANLASTPSGSKISLSWNNTASNQNGFQVERSTDGALFSILGSTGKTATSYADSTVVAGVGYYYRVAAFNSGGNSSYSNVITAGTAPLAPSGLTATPISTTQISLKWTNNATNATGLILQRSLDNRTFVTLATLTPTTVAYDDLGLSPATKYYYRIQSTGEWGVSAYSTATATTLRH